MPAVVYWDTSALLKLYAPEPDSAHYRSILRHQGEAIGIGFLHRVELCFALTAKELRGEIGQGDADRIFESFLEHRRGGRFFETPWGDDIAHHARRALDVCRKSKPPVMLRALDGLHLGCMLAAGIQKLITADVRLGRAAVCAGLKLAD